jgi:hypothetical protein
MIVIIVGMHRSGTSALAGMLHGNGVVMGEQGDFHPPPMKENPKGFYENRRFRNINDAILQERGYRVKEFSPQVPRWEGRVSKGVWDNMVALVRHYDGHHKVWGWKDPRTCLTVWHWLRVIERCKGHHRDVRVVVMLRKHEDVSRSMQNKGNKERMYPGQFAALSAIYYANAMSALVASGVEYLEVPFNLLMEDTKWVGKLLTKYLGHEVRDTSFVEPQISKVGGK